MSIDLRLGTWQEALADVGEVDAVITDPPYGERTHGGHDAAASTTDRQSLSYDHWTGRDVDEFVRAWSPRCRGWFCAMTSHDLIPAWEAAFNGTGRYVFAPLPCVIRGMSVRVTGDGPSSWAVWLVVARPRTREAMAWGTLPGAYVVAPQRGGHIGGKPLDLMQAIVRDYSRPGDIVCDPCAGGATTLLAAAIEGRRGIGAEMDPETYRKAQERIARGYTRTLVPHDPLEGASQGGLFAGEG